MYCRGLICYLLCVCSSLTDKNDTTERHLASGFRKTVAVRLGRRRCAENVYYSAMCTRSPTELRQLCRRWNAGESSRRRLTVDDRSWPAGVLGARRPDYGQAATRRRRRPPSSSFCCCCNFRSKVNIVFPLSLEILPRVLFSPVYM